MQAAVFDALNGIDRRYAPIHVAPPDSCLGASRPTAVVQAAYEILSKVYGATATAANQQPTLDGRYAASLADIRSRDRAASVDKGIACGHEVATGIWDWRSADGFTTPLPPFFGVVSTRTMAQHANRSVSRRATADVQPASTRR